MANQEPVSNSDARASTCNDGIQNQEETSIDCGGPCANCAVLTTGQFVHPGAFNSQEELDPGGHTALERRIRPALKLGEARRRPHGLSHINSQNNDANTSRDDAIAAYAQALLWYYDDTYAERTIAILNSWADLQSFTAGSDQDKLQAGWIGALFAPAAEIMRGYSGWAAIDRSNLQTMFKRAFYPQLDTASFWNGNVDLTQIDAMLSIAVFNEDLDMFTDSQLSLV